MAENPLAWPRTLADLLAGARCLGGPDYDACYQFSYAYRIAEEARCLVPRLTGFAPVGSADGGGCSRYQRPDRGLPAVRLIPELPPRFSRLKIVCGSFGNVPGFGMLVGFAGFGASFLGWSAMAMSLAPRQARGRLSRVRASRASARGTAVWPMWPHHRALTALSAEDGMPCGRRQYLARGDSRPLRTWFAKACASL